MAPGGFTSRVDQINGGTGWQAIGTPANQFHVFLAGTTRNPLALDEVTPIDVTNPAQIGLHLASAPIEPQAFDVWYRRPPDNSTIIGSALYDNVLNADGITQGRMLWDPAAAIAVAGADLSFTFATIADTDPSATIVVSGTYAPVAPPSLDYSLDGGGTWTGAGATDRRREFLVHHRGRAGNAWPLRGDDPRPCDRREHRRVERLPRHRMLGADSADARQPAIRHGRLPRQGLPVPEPLRLGPGIDRISGPGRSSTSRQQQRLRPGHRGQFPDADRQPGEWAACPQVRPCLSAGAVAERRKLPGSAPHQFGLRDHRGVQAGLAAGNDCAGRDDDRVGLSSGRRQAAHHPATHHRDSENLAQTRQCVQQSRRPVGHERRGR